MLFCFIASAGAFFQVSVNYHDKSYVSRFFCFTAAAGASLKVSIVHNHDKPYVSLLFVDSGSMRLNLIFSCFVGERLLYR